MNHLTFKDIQRQQLGVALQTHNEWPNLFESLNIGISGVMSALNETAKVPDLAKDSGRVLSMSWIWVYKSVFTMSSSILSAEMGYYAESVSLNRSVAEALVQILYLAKHPADIDKLPYISTKRKLTFAWMFGKIAPNYYENYYHSASEFVHPGWGSNAFKMRRDNLGGEFIDQGVIYNADGFTRVFNELTVMTLGFLRALAILFPTSDWNPEALHEWREAVAEMQAALDRHILFTGGRNDWHNISEPLWNPK